jgi:pimeloyl-ACP methyl ester carboxylesterase
MAEPIAQDLVTGTVDVDGTSVTYFTAGKKDSKLPPIVLIHGTAGSTENHFSFTFPTLARDQRVVSLDLTDIVGKPEITVADLERQVAGVVNHLVPEGPISVLGYSLGAVVAASYAAHNPDRVKNLILVAGWIKTDTQQLVRQDVQAALRGDIAAYKKLSLVLAFGVPFVAKRTLDDLLTVAPPPAGGMEFIGKLSDLNRIVDITDEMDKIKATTLIVGCTYDMMVPRHHSLALFGAIDDARYTEMSSGHAIVWERPSELTLAVREFLANPQAHPAGTVIPEVQP